MKWLQELDFDPTVPVVPGYCLTGVQNGFHAPWAGSTATDGWNRAQFKHTNQEFPEGVACVLWFSLSDEPAGHVVARMPDGSIYSVSRPKYRNDGTLDPLWNTLYHHPTLAHLLSYYGGRLTLRGWSEDLNGTRVIKEDNMEATTYVVQALAEGGLGRTAAGDKNLLNNVGQPVEKVIDTFRTYPEWKERQRKANDYDRLDADNQALKAQLAASGGTFEQVTEQLYRKK